MVHYVGVAPGPRASTGQLIWRPFCVDCSRRTGDWRPPCNQAPAWADPLGQRLLGLVAIDPADDPEHPAHHPNGNHP